MLYLIRFASEFHSIIGHTYTIIAGFVAIGIPLSIQFSAQYSDKHDNALLSTRLTRGKYVNPKSILSLSFLYMVLSLYYLTFASSKHSFLSLSATHLDILKFSLPMLFAVLILCTFYFYWRLFKKITVKSSLQIQDYLQLDVKKNSKANLFIKFSKSQLAHLNRRFPWLTKCLESLITEAPIQKQPSADIDSINAGLELLIYNIEKRSWSFEFEETLNQFHKAIHLRYFSHDSEKKHKLSETGLVVVKSYWNTLLRLVKHARKNEDIPMSFQTQRLIASLMYNIVYHPMRSSIIAESFLEQSNSKISLVQDIYELARWQDYQLNKGIDLILECEWFDGIFYAPDNIELKNIKSSLEGLSYLHNLAVDVFDIIAKHQPNTAIKFVKNISRAASHGQEQQFISYYLGAQETEWLADYWSDFNKITFCVENIDKLVEKIESLYNGEAFEQYRNGISSKPLSKHSLKCALSVIKLDEIFECIHLKLVKRMGWSISARLAYYERWVEFYECLYWKQPKEANAHHLGETLLAHSTKELADLIYYDHQQIERYWRFHERHAIKVYVFRAFLFQLCFFAEQGEEPSLIYTSGGFDDIQTQMSIIESLLEQERYVRNVRQWNAVVTKACKNLRHSIEALNDRKVKLIKTQKINEINWQSAQKLLENNWATTFELKDVMDVSYVNTVNRNKCKLLKYKVPRSELITEKSSNSDISSMIRQMERNFLSQLYNKCIDSAEQCAFELKEQDHALYFAPLKTLQKLRFKRSGSMYWKSSSYKSVLAIRSEHTQVLIDCTKTKISITKNLCSNNNSPLFISLEDKNEDKVQVNAEIYFELELLEEGAITFC
ncbi:hypothetical protein [Pseudoalteromonas sp. DY56-GL79]|uniref:hypothetical protein n=1 Tax=Pseudoalteromonas sp. DY56-GL79 TaxID=2967131 RepID=UPI00352B4C1C